MAAFRSVEIFRDSTRTVVAVEAADSRRGRTRTGSQFYADIVPVAIIVHGRDGAYALDMDAKPVGLDRLKQDVPELDSIVARLNKAQIDDRG